MAAIALTGCTSGDGVAATSRPAAPADPLARQLYVPKDTAAARQVREWAADPSRNADRAVIAAIAARPVAVWLTGEGNGAARAGRVARAAARAGRTPVFVAYGIPRRDCGLYSTGGAADAPAYRAWLSGVSAAIGARPAIVIVEPDASSQAASGTCAGQAPAERLALLRDAVTILGRGARTRVYLDAGHANWVSPARLAPALRRAGIAGADGFAVNVSNFQTTARSIAYGERLSRLLGGAHFVIDTSRNGNGPYESGDAEDWCNPPGRALGRTPTTRTGRARVDAYLWVKVPGESDGTCKGGPAAGTWWPDYALGLARNAGFSPQG
ncbi:MAG: glycoside hydrolase family 6 protein [Thermoleophilia bacterium]